ncbi:MAG: histidine kinase dimerization/phospho-acceptor domain-containing protein, partial [Paracoccus sp. (in: a-proteobacteria)]|nr:histidine kinase dimerization/phospho-acceptor domain-containing protein [Paracoccus sp. (in: a-proteobacteria)]
MPTEAAHQIIAALPIPALVLDREARISETNAASTALLGAPLRGRQFVTVVRHAAINQAVDAVLGRPGASAPTPDPTLREVESGGHRLRVQISAQGRDVPCEVTVSPLEFCRGALVVIEDSSAIEQAGQMRRDFVANVSHELRTPLTALMGFI